MTKLQDYFIYDGRANHDFESACCVECFDAINDNEEARYHRRNYHGQDTALCDANDNIIY